MKTTSAPPPIEDLLDPFAIVAVGLSAVFLVAGVVWSHMAGSMLRMLILALALAYIGRRVIATQLPAKALLREWTPFDGAAEPQSIPVPAELLDLVRELRFADDEATRRAAVPGPVRRILDEAWARHLAEGHGIEIDEPGALDLLPEGLSPASLRYITAMVDPTAPSAPHNSDPSTLAELGPILNDLETL